MNPATALDPGDARVSRRAAGLLRRFNEAGVLDVADVQVAGRVAALAVEPVPEAAYSQTRTR